MTVKEKPGKTEPLWRCIKTAGGEVAVAYTAAGLYALELPQDGTFHQNDSVTISGDDPQWLIKLAADLKAYFDGKPVCFTCPIDESGYAPFFKRVLTVCAKIPFGEKRTYRWLAEQAGSPKAVRAAGQAMANNRTPVVVPCHRVLRSNGELGGFSGGLHWKEKLLQLESCEV